jgi:hypothetical protein
VQVIVFEPGAAIAMVELAGGKPPARVRDRAVRFLAENKRLAGRPGSIYTSRSFWVDEVGDPWENLDGPLWIAAYRSMEPPVPRAWSAWNFWQHSDKAKVPGVEVTCGLDYFHGDEARLRRLTLPWRGDAESARTGHPQNPQKPHAGACGPLSRVLRVPGTAPFAGGTAPTVGPGGTGRPGRVRKSRENRTCDDRAADYYVFYVTTSGSMVPGARGAGRGLWVVKGTIEGLVPVALGGGTVVNVIDPHWSIKIQNTRTNHGELACIPTEGKPPNKLANTVKDAVLHRGSFLIRVVL